MNFLWNLKLYQMEKGFRVVISGDGKTVKTNGATVESAYRNAEVQFVRKPPFVPFLAEKRVWKVIVLGHFQEPGDAQVKRASLTFLTLAATSDEAFTRAPSQAESMAHVGVKWLGFETLQASPVEFPYVLADTTEQVLRGRCTCKSGTISSDCPRCGPKSK